MSLFLTIRGMFISKPADRFHPVQFEALFTVFLDINFFKRWKVAVNEAENNENCSI